MSTFHDVLKKAENLNPVKHASKTKKDIPIVFVVILVIVVFSVIFNISKVNYTKKIAAGKKNTAGKLSSGKTAETKPTPAPVKKDFLCY